MIFCRHRLTRTAALIMLAAAVAACQATDAPSGKAGMGEGPGNDFRERRGWDVEFVPAAAGTPAHCRGQRRNAGDSGLAIIFVAGEETSGFRLVGVPPDRGVPEQDSIVAAFDQGDRRIFPAARSGADERSLLATFPTAEYEETLHPFGRARSVTLRMQRGGPLGTLALSGSAWAINATDECRRMSIPPVAPRP